VQNAGSAITNEVAILTHPAFRKPLQSFKVNFIGVTTTTTTNNIL
jgi:hypothetical protein